MNITHLRYAVEVEKTCSFSKAAENLYMGQPNLSKAIKELETSLGMHIFKRTPKGVFPTKKGEEFLVYARLLVSQVAEIEAIYTPQSKNKVSFGISIPRASYITWAFTEFVNSLSDKDSIDLDYRETNTIKTINRVVEGEDEAGIIRYPANHEEYFANLMTTKAIKCKKLYDFTYLALMSADNPVAAKDVVNCIELSNCIEIVHGDVITPYTTSKKTIKTEPSGSNQKKEIFVYERGSQFDILCNVTNSFMWVSPIPKKLLDRYGLVQRNFPGADKVYRDALIYNESYGQNETLISFKNALEKTIEEISSKSYS